MWSFRIASVCIATVVLLLVGSQEAFSWSGVSEVPTNRRRKPFLTTTRTSDNRLVESSMTRDCKQWVGAVLVASSLAFGIIPAPAASAQELVPAKPVVVVEQSTALSTPIIDKALLAEEDSSSLSATASQLDKFTPPSSDGKEASAGGDTLMLAEDDTTMEAKKDASSTSATATATVTVESKEREEVDHGMKEESAMTPINGDETAIAEAPTEERKVEAATPAATGGSPDEKTPVETEEPNKASSDWERRLTLDDNSIVEKAKEEKSEREPDASTALEDTSSLATKVESSTNSGEAVQSEDASGADSKTSSFSKTAQPASAENDAQTQASDASSPRKDLVAQVETPATKTQKQESNGGRDYVGKKERELEEGKFAQHELSDAQIAWLRKH